MGYFDGLKYDAERNTSDVLKTFHTRQLLGIMRSVRKNLDCYDKEDYLKLMAYKARVKEVLSTREHIPNKLESKRIRQLRAKHKKK